MSNTIPYHTIPYHTIPYHTGNNADSESIIEVRSVWDWRARYMLSNTIQYNTIKYNSQWCIVSLINEKYTHPIPEFARDICFRIFVCSKAREWEIPSLSNTSLITLTVRSTLLRLDRLFTASCSQWVSGWVGGPEYRDYVMIYANDTFIQYIYIYTYVCMYLSHCIPEWDQIGNSVIEGPR